MLRKFADISHGAVRASLAVGGLLLALAGPAAGQTPAAPTRQARKAGGGTAATEARGVGEPQGPADAHQPPAQPAPAAPSGPTYYPFTPVSGIYTGSSDKDLGKLSGIKAFEGLKFRGWVDVYIDHNFNNPSTAVVNALQPVTAVKAPNATVQGRTFDLHGHTFTLDLAAIDVEKVPEVAGVGFKLDMAFGDTQNIYNDTIIAALGPNSLSQFDKVFQHASISYLAPIGKGLRFDFGKFVTHIGGETIESVKKANFLPSFFYTYAISL